MLPVLALSLQLSVEFILYFFQSLHFICMFLLDYIQILPDLTLHHLILILNRFLIRQMPSFDKFLHHRLQLFVFGF